MSDDHADEMRARAERRAAREQRSWQEGPTPGRAKEPRTTTPPWVLRKIKANKELQDRRRLRRLSDAAATAEGRIWDGDGSRQRHPSQQKRGQ